MTPEEAYEEALRRIREAEETGAVELDLSISELNRIPLELKRLISLQLLNFFYCFRLSGDLSPLASLTSLQTLSFIGCKEAQRSFPAGQPHLTPIVQPLQLPATQRLDPVGRPHLAQIAQSLQLRTAQRLGPLDRPHLARIARPHQLRTAQRLGPVSPPHLAQNRSTSTGVIISAAPWPR